MYLETTYDANQICNDTTASLKDKDGHYFRLRRTLTYLGHDMVHHTSLLCYHVKWQLLKCFCYYFQVFFPINVAKDHWYLVVVNATKRAVQVLDSMGPGTRRRPHLQKLVCH